MRHTTSLTWMTRLGCLCSGPQGNRGVILIGSYLMLSLLLLYASGITTSTSTQRLAFDRLRDRTHSLDLVQGVTEQFRDDFFTFVRTQVYQEEYQGDAVQAMAWLDNWFGAGGAKDMPPAFALPMNTTAGIAGEGISETNPRSITLPVAGSARAWIVEVRPTTPPDQFARELIVEARAAAGSVPKRIRSTYRIGLQVSDIFRYAYFINNYGWFSVPTNLSTHITVNGEVRANGNLSFQGAMSRMYANGDLYASKNEELGVPGTITGSPGQLFPGAGSSSFPYYYHWQSKNVFRTDPNSWAPAYWNPSPLQSRPARQLTLSGQPIIGGGTTPKKLPLGEGWEYHNDSPSSPRKFPLQPVQDMPYIGDLSLYEEIATKYKGGVGSSLTYPGGTVTLSDGSTFSYPAGTIDKATPHDGTSGPLILVGTALKPIVIDGPVVVENDVIIKGVIQGRGTIYSKRNVHILGQVTYKDPPQWDLLQRDSVSGRIRTVRNQAIVGKVCANGTSIPPTETCP